MAISSIDHITADNAERYILSIRLRSDGLSFCGYIPSEAERFFHVNRDFDRTVPYLRALKDFFFEYELLSFGFKRVNILWAPSRYLLIPETLFQVSKQNELHAFACVSSGNRMLHHVIKAEQSVLLFDMEEDIYEFCSRSFLYPRFFHPMYPLLVLWRKQSRDYKSGQLFVFLQKKQMDLACFADEKLLFANTFSVESADDMLYYILYVWKQLNLDQQNDRVRITGNASLCMEIIGLLRDYIKHPEPLNFPVEVFLKGEAVVQASPDLIALSLCEL